MARGVEPSREFKAMLEVAHRIAEACPSLREDAHRGPLPMGVDYHVLTLSDARYNDAYITVITAFDIVTGSSILGYSRECYPGMRERKTWRTHVQGIDPRPYVDIVVAHAVHELGVQERVASMDLEDLPLLAVSGNDEEVYWATQALQHITYS